MKLNILHPSNYIRYTDNELTPEERKHNETYALLASECPEHILRAAQPDWNEAFIK